MQYEVRALSPDNQIIALVVDAQDEGDARRQVEARGLHATQLVPSAHAAAARGVAWRRISLVLFSQELLALLMAGLSIVEGLEALVEREGGARLRGVLERLLAGLREGKRFSACSPSSRMCFPPLYVGIVRAAEGTSDLPRSLQRYVDYQARIDTVRNKLVSAAIYPSILLVVGGGVSTFLIAFVVPRFAMIYEGTGRSLPWMSQVLLDWGKFASAHGLPLLVSAMGLAVACGMAVRAAIAKVGPRQPAGAHSGAGATPAHLPALAALSDARHAARRRHPDRHRDADGRRHDFARVARGADAGACRRAGWGELSSAFQAHHLTTPISLRMLRVGERSGELGAMLTQSAAFYDGEISRWIDRFTRMFEPF